MPMAMNTGELVENDVVEMTQQKNFVRFAIVYYRITFVQQNPYFRCCF